jgi:hydrogenase expression/formation protein HypD
MKFLDEFQNQDWAKALIKKIALLCPKRPVNFMEVCGTHTMAIHRYGIKGMLPPQLKLLSGPGCPVCVTPVKFIDSALAYASQPEFMIATFGDLMKVPGSQGNLSQAKAHGAQVKIVYSPMEALTLAQKNSKAKIIFLAVGFETTIPVIAATLKAAQEENCRNFYILGAVKTIPQALRILLSSKELKLDGLILPGHVSTIIGASPYEFIAREFATPAVITGFEPLDILLAIYMLLKQISEGEAAIQIQYTRSVKPEGNPLAQALMAEVFIACNSTWRGLGEIPASGLQLKPAYQNFDIEKALPLKVGSKPDNPACACGEVLRGVKSPTQCLLFGKGCNPETPVGACMVSSEGTCAAYYKYGNER